MRDTPHKPRAQSIRRIGLSRTPPPYTELTFVLSCNKPKSYGPGGLFCADKDTPRAGRITSVCQRSRQACRRASLGFPLPRYGARDQACEEWLPHHDLIQSIRCLLAIWWRAAEQSWVGYRGFAFREINEYYSAGQIPDCLPRPGICYVQGCARKVDLAWKPNLIFGSLNAFENKSFLHN